MKLQIKSFKHGEFIIGRMKTWIICFEYITEFKLIRQIKRLKKYEM